MQQATTTILHLKHAGLAALLLLLPEFAACTSGGFSSSTGSATNGNASGSTQTTSANATVAPAVDSDTPLTVGDGGTLGSTPTATIGSTGSWQKTATSCGASGVTQAKLLTPTLHNATPGNYLAYEISVAACDGTLQPLTATHIFFDFDGRDAFNDHFTFTVTAQGVSVDGAFQEIIGSDLFGHTGPTFAHMASLQEISLASATNTVVLRIELEGDAIVPGESQLPLASSQLATYLAFGNAAPVTETVQLIGSAGSP